jgi:hypothetical protein
MNTRPWHASASATITAPLLVMSTLVLVALYVSLSAVSSEEAELDDDPACEASTGACKDTTAKALKQRNVDTHHCRLRTRQVLHCNNDLEFCFVRLQ